MPLVAAIDVGTASARAGVLDAAGRLLGRAEAPLDIHRSADGHAEHASEQVWAAAAAALRAARAEAGARAEDVAGLAFDATCSLVLRDRAGRPLGVSTTGDDSRDTILWHDHRAVAEAAEASRLDHRVVTRSGGTLSPEMQIPKLMWLKRRLPGAWARAGLAFDLADFLSWRATGATARSRCTLASKWGFLADEPAGWPQDFLDAVGLDDLRARTGQPETATAVGADLGPLTPDAARDLGLTPATRVAAGLIDAHAGALGLLGGLAPAEAGRRVALIAGTSSCLMGFGPTPRPLPGVWGPYLDVALPGLWMREAGQSASGALLDHVLALRGLEPGRETHARVIARVRELRAATPDLAPRLHVLPDFHGRRGPDPDPQALGAVAGLPLDASFDALARLYWRACVGIALGLAAVLDHLVAHGQGADVVHVAGGHIRNPLLMELYADATGRRIVESAAPDATLLGTAMAAATAAGLHAGLAAAGAAMARDGAVRDPDPAAAPRIARDRAALAALAAAQAGLDALAAP
ncbi:FGGY-family carbohydrate kinase [Amaricoccus sp.]|uniref:FGGY-family carbohydrate kinase n=1 Tax=Amaricoccus sp. TaxID=1872485 RepID=UPI001B6FE9B5|nr:FGGY-family carbohydrate kinase [Amaricoccus sp.]MBP7002890.1 carbohydrate kinase [Amaricoccus sp.]